jgi:hypothetical protein
LQALPIRDRHEFGLFGAVFAEGLHTHRFLDQRLDAGFVIVGLIRVGSRARGAAAPDARDFWPGSGWWHGVSIRWGDAAFASRKRVNQESRAPFRLYRNGKGSLPPGSVTKTPGGWKPTAGRTEFRSVRDA